MNLEKLEKATVGFGSKKWKPTNRKRTEWKAREMATPNRKALFEYGSAGVRLVTQTLELTNKGTLGNAEQNTLGVTSNCTEYRH